MSLENPPSKFEYSCLMSFDLSFLLITIVLREQTQRTYLESGQSTEFVGSEAGSENQFLNDRFILVKIVGVSSVFGGVSTAIPKSEFR